jgi:hypothetical protein
MTLTYLAESAAQQIDFLDKQPQSTVRQVDREEKRSPSTKLRR